MREGPAARVAVCFAWMLAICPLGSVMAGPLPSPPPDKVVVNHLDLSFPQGAVTVDVLGADIVKLAFIPSGGRAVTPTSVMAPGPSPAPATTPDIRMDWQAASGRLAIGDARVSSLLSIDLAAFARGEVTLDHGADDVFYGIRSYTAFDTAAGGMLRQGKEVATAGTQGFAGAPFVWSTAGYGILADAEGATFQLGSGPIGISGRAGPIRTLYLIVGKPATLFAALADLSGHSPLFPKWAMGFTNSQWGIDQKELLGIVATYRAKQIPIDNMTIDFDWKAWGEDNYGEFRWNETTFPDGPTGALKQQLDAMGLRLTGIMKPRIHLDTVEGRYATEHGFWMPTSKAALDYFSHKTVRDIDFGNPLARTWFFNDALKHSFDTGIVGWWNDEADNDDSDTEFENMQRALYEGQRAHSDKRVWSINRNFYLGSQRYAYGVWSGDIATGFDSMKGQRQRMLSAINVGAMQWGMDGGGFRDGTPTPENYARWIQFGAFTPIFRVHGDFGQKRQPWVYGPVAEKAAAEAIRLRYRLLPYIYAYEFQRHQFGVGLVRPLLFDWPGDAHVRDDVEAWLFGDYLLASPVVEPGQTAKDIYLPPGRWIDYFSGQVVKGGTVVHRAVDASEWSDIPLYIRDGAIIPTQPAMNYIGEKPVTQWQVDIFASTSSTVFTTYDDDGETYAYEQGRYRAQKLSVQRHDDGVSFIAEAPTGSYASPVSSYLLAFHGLQARGVTISGTSIPKAASTDAIGDKGWVTGQDRYGPVTYVKIAAGQACDVKLEAGE